MVTAGLSIWTAIALWKSIPDALRIPSVVAMNASVQHLENVVAELHATRGQLVEREKQAALGALVAGLAHELNTPLGNALTVATTLHDQDIAFQDQLGSSLSRRDLVHLLDTQAEGLALLLNSLQRANVLIDQFKLLALEETADAWHEVQLDDWLSECLCAARARLGPDALQVTIHVPATLTLRTAPTVLAQVLMTLLGFIHGRFMQQHREIDCTAQVADTSIDLLISAQGLYLAQEESRHVFDPFYAGQMQNNRDVLGMHVAYQLVERVLYGHLRMVSHEHEGTQFVLHLPKVI